MPAVRTLLRPKWIAGHLLAVVAVVTFANLGQWQLRRHDDKAARNAAIEQGLAQEPAPFAELAEGERAYRRTVVRGRFRPEREFLLSPRTERGPGHHVITPLELPDGQVLLVDRGWVPYRIEEPPVDQAPPPEGEVELRGVLLPAAQADPRALRAGDGRLLRVRAVDPAELAGPGTVPDTYLLQATAPPSGELPVPAPLPERDAGPHLSYAVQWFLFAAVVTTGYPLLLRKVSREAAGPG